MQLGPQCSADKLYTTHVPKTQLFNELGNENYNDGLSL